jgi:hypothetical protein
VSAVRKKSLKADETDGTDSTVAPDTNHAGGSQTANQDERIMDQQLPAPNAPTVTPGDEGDDALGSGQDDEDAHDLVQSGRSKGKSWRF